MSQFLTRALLLLLAGTCLLLARQADANQDKASHHPAPVSR